MCSSDLAPASVAEDGPTSLVYTVTLDQPSFTPVTIPFTIGGTALFGDDYTQSGATSFSATAGSVTIAANSTTATITIAPMADTVFEPDETVVLTLGSGTGYTVGAASAATGTILNDDLGNPSIGSLATSEIGRAHV